MKNAETGCCPRFIPEPWNEKEITWGNKLFVKDRVISFLHIPLNFGWVMRRNMQMIDALVARDPQNIVLSDENSLWGADVYIAVNKDISEMKMEKISGTFLSKVFEGPYRNIRKWVEEMNSYVKSKGKETKKIFFFYTTCPKCAKVYGKNYVVLFAEI